MKRFRFFDEDFPAHYGNTLNYDKGMNPEKKYAWITTMKINEMESVEE